MRIRVKDELLIINILLLLLIPIIIFLPSNVLRIILGLPLVLFFPGYTLMAALFPSKGSLGGIERVALSFGMSIAVVPLMGLILHYTPWGITLYSTLSAIAIFIVVSSVIAYRRRQALAPQERFAIAFHIPLLQWGGTTTLDKALSVLLVLSVLGAIGTLGYVIVEPNIGERFTEFYILGAEGKGGDYPMELAVGEEGRVTIGIINQEQKKVSYQIEMRVGEDESSTVGPIVLGQGEKWEREVGFIPQKAGDGQRVEFLLYKDEALLYGDGGVYTSPHLWINVTQE